MKIIEKQLQIHLSGWTTDQVKHISTRFGFLQVEYEDFYVRPILKEFKGAASDKRTGEEGNLN